jgi:glutamate racemase
MAHAQDFRYAGRNGFIVNLSESDKFNTFLKKKEVTILITDSGLGGISICAEIASGLRHRHLFKKVNLVYFNAWPEQNRGYNRLKNTAERIHVFDNALQGMMRFKPDFIMLACNTLSVLYQRTEFSRSVDIPVVDIVGFGVDMMAECLQTSTNHQAVILGTVTTIDSHVHRDHLVQRGIQPTQIISQACDQLATEIEKGPANSTVSQMIKRYMQQAVLNINPAAVHLYAALCCTHFGYCQELIQDTLAGFADKPVVILNPNRKMAAYLLANCKDNLCSNTIMEIQVVSKITWEERKINSISSLIHSISAETANALINYTPNPNLFG